MPNVGTSPDGNYVRYDGSINVGGDRSWRNNNPGNIEAGTFADSLGAIGSDGRFAIFPDPETGARALQSLLTSDSYQGLTIEQAMERYAPPTENNTDAYTSFITQQVGVDPSMPMSDLTADQMASFGNAIETFEGGATGTSYQAGDARAPSWVQDVFDGSTPDAPDPEPSPTLDPTPEPTPDLPSDPIPTPLPDPVPDPTPDPVPDDPTPDPPDPEPVDPTPDPTPDPSPDPSPEPGPDPGVGGGDGGAGDPDGSGGGEEGGGGGEEGGGGGGEDGGGGGGGDGD